MSKHIKSPVTIVGALLLFVAVTTVVHAQTCTVNWTNVHQMIDGFGGGQVFANPSTLDPVSPSNMDTLFLTNNTSQLGLTMMRIRIDSSSNFTDAVIDGQNATARGVRILATPWSPPAGYKNNDNIVGGSLLTSKFAAYATFLNNFAGYMKSNGAPLAAISIQNEPDAIVDYESCIWTPAQLQAFCHTNAGAITNAPVLMPESESYDTNYSEPTLNDSVAASHVTFIAGHLYGVTNIQDYPNAHNKGKRTWMTEYLVNDQTISTAIDTAAQIHDCLTVGNMSAYIWWHLVEDANGLVDASGVPQIRGFAMAQWSWFVRPGYYRIDASADASSALISAFNNTSSGKFAIVAVNTNTNSSITQTLNLANFPAVSSVTPWITSATMSLSNQTPIAVNNASFTYTLPAESVVTFAGQSYVPSSITISNASYNPAKPAFVLTWNSIAGATYSVFKTNALGGAAKKWPVLVTGYPIGGATGGALMYTDTTATVGSSFYKVSNP